MSSKNQVVNVRPLVAGSRNGNGMVAATDRPPVPEPQTQPINLPQSSTPKPPIAATGKAGLGLHMGADGGDISAEERIIFSDLNPDVIKALSSHSEKSMRWLAQAHSSTDWIVRAFLDFSGRAPRGERVTAQQFFEWTIGDTLRNVRAIGDPARVWVELHNEPNLWVEGWRTSWDNGETTFAQWLGEVLQLYRQTFAGEGLQAVRFLFPGLSPQRHSGPQMAASDHFLEVNRAVVEQFDGLAQHVYWGDGGFGTQPRFGAMSTLEMAISEVDAMIARFPTMPIWITESCNNRKHSTADEKAQEYLTFWRAMRYRPNVQGITYYIATASNPLWGWDAPGAHGEVWAGTNIAQRVGQRTAGYKLPRHLMPRPKRTVDPPVDPVSPNPPPPTSSTVITDKHELLKKTLLGINVGHYEQDTEFLTIDGKTNGRELIVTDGAGNRMANRPIVDDWRQFAVTRFMDWQKINVLHSKVALPTPARDVSDIRALSASYANGTDWREIPAVTLPDGRVGRPWAAHLGVPLEAIATFSAECNTYPWICIPHGARIEADGSYSNQFTAMMQEVVDRVLALQVEKGDGRVPIFEFSNEIWNGGFRQKAECAELARTFLADIDDSVPQWQAAAAWQVDRTLELASYVNGKGIVVLSGQASNVGYMAYMLERVQAQGKMHLIDAITIAPYYGQKQQHFDNQSQQMAVTFDPLENVRFDNWTVASHTNGNNAAFEQALKQLYVNLERFISGAMVNGKWERGIVDQAIQTHLDLCGWYSTAERFDADRPIRLLAYEGGAHLEYNKHHYQNHDESQVRLLFRQMNRSTFIATLSNKLIREWHKSRAVKDADKQTRHVHGGIFCAYNAASSYHNGGDVIASKFFGHLEIMPARTYLAHKKFQAWVWQAKRFYTAATDDDHGLEIFESDDGAKGLATLDLAFVRNSFRTLPGDLNLNALPAGTRFTASWQYKNVGNFDWSEGYKIRYAAQGDRDRPMTDKTDYLLSEVGTMDADGLVTICLPMTAPHLLGREIKSQWHFVAPDGELLDNYFYITVICAASDIPNQHRRTLDCTFVRDHTVADYDLIPSGRNLSKQWAVKNTGKRKWSNAFRLVFISGDLAMAAGRTTHLVPDAASQEEVIITLPISVPPPRAEPYCSTWRLQDDRGNLFGDILTVKLYAVQTPKLDTSSLFYDASSWHSQRDPLWRDTPLGHGQRTIGDWGCLMTCFSMMLSAYGDKVTPQRLNERMKQADGAFQKDTSVTMFNAPTKLNRHVKWVGHYRPRAANPFSYDTTHVAAFQRLIDDSLAAGRVVLAQVDSTSADWHFHVQNDQHWVVIVSKAGAADYLVLDPILAPPQNPLIGLMSKYGIEQANWSAQDNLLAAMQSVLVYERTG